MPEVVVIIGTNK